MDPISGAMARAAAENSEDEYKDAHGVDVVEVNTDRQDTVLNVQVDDPQLSGGTTTNINFLQSRIDDAIESNSNDKPPSYEGQGAKAIEDEKVQADILDDVEKSMLPFMPPASTSRQPSVVDMEDESAEASQEPMSETAESSTPAALTLPPDEGTENIRRSFDAQHSNKDLSQRSLEPADLDMENEKPPPLPPRRNASPLLAPAKPELKKTSSWDEIFAPLATTSPLPLTNLSSENNRSQAGEDSVPKSPPLLAKKSSSLSSPDNGSKGIASPASTEEIKPGKIWTSVLLEEEQYIERMNKFTNIFYGVVIKEWPVLEKHMEAIVLARQLAPLHQEYILDVVKEQTQQNPFAVCDPRLFATWASKTYKVLKEYSRRFPHALYALRLTQSRDKKFGPCIETIGLNLTKAGQSWEDHLVLPIAQLDTYITKLQGIAQWLDEGSAPILTKEQSRVKATLETLQRLKTQCSDLAEKSISQEEIQSLHRKVHTVDTSLVDVLELSSPDRRIVYHGSTALKLNNRGPWKPMQVVLLDNYIFWGKLKSTKDTNHKGMMIDSIRVIEKPVPVTQIAIRLPLDSTKTRTSSYLDELPRGVILYELFVDINVKPGSFTTLTIGTFSYEERSNWYQKLSEVAGTKSPQIPE